MLCSMSVYLETVWVAIWLVGLALLFATLTYEIVSTRDRRHKHNGGKQ